MTKKVYVVTDAELGWDCLIGVFDADKFSLEELEEYFKDKYTYPHVFEKTIEAHLTKWD